MATIMTPTSVKEIKPYKRDYEVTVRVLRRWIRESDNDDPTKRSTYGMELILIDKEGELIQASVAKNLVRIFKPLISEGRIYTISKFETEQNLGNDRATFHKCRIQMKFTTKVRAAEEQEIPSKSYKFYNYDDIIHGNVPNEYYIDVIGVLGNIHEEKCTKGYKRMSIDIINEQKQRLSVTVWGAYFPDIKRIEDVTRTLPEKPILLLRCVQRKEWFGTVTLSTTRGATVFEINPQIPEIEAFKNRIMSLSNEAFSGPIGESSGSSILSGANIKSLASIKETDKAGFYVTYVYIDEMNMSVHWYFNSCGKCLGKITQEADGLWYCKKSDCTNADIGAPKAYPRFQAKVDANDGDSVKIQLMLWDSPISKIIGKKASTILEEQASSMTDEQKGVYNEIMDAVVNNRGGVFFVHGYGGTGKTFIWRTLCAALRSRGQIVLPVASSGIASTLLPGGMTAHSRLSIPINVVENSTCSRIKPGSDLAELLIRAKLIIWDEAPMTHRYAFEAVDRSLRDVMRFSPDGDVNQPFGGKVVVFGGDFRQILPVIPKGSRSEIVNASLCASDLWSNCKVLKLTKNMRLQAGDSCSDVAEIKEFSDWILKVGDGEAGDPNDGEIEIELPQDNLIKHFNDPISSIVDAIYPSLEDQLWNPEYLQERAILAPTHEIVELVNDYVLSRIDAQAKIYYSSDEVSKDESNVGVRDLYSTEFLNGIKCSGLPNHELKLKVGAIVMLLRNIDQSRGLCNGTRLIVTHLGERLIRATVVSGSHKGDKVHIARITLTPSDTSQFPVQFDRRQFPLAVCFAMTINKSQGQSLAHVGLYLPRSVFTHGQLYVAISRVTSKKGLKILICDNDSRVSSRTNNVVYKEIFQKL